MHEELLYKQGKLQGRDFPRIPTARCGWFFYLVFTTLTDTKEGWASDCNFLGSSGRQGKHWSWKDKNRAGSAAQLIPPPPFFFFSCLPHRYLSGVKIQY